MSVSDENLMEAYESKFQASINLLLASDVNTGNRRYDVQSLQIATKNLMQASQKLQQFFIRAQINYHDVNKSAANEEEISRMRHEIARKDALIAEKTIKFKELLKEVDIIKQKQETLK